MSGALQDDAVSPAAWYATLPAPALASSPDEAGRVHMRRYTGTHAEMRQPALTDALLCMHLGGAKRVRRWRGGHMNIHDVELGALTLLPAGQQNRWVTQGPIDFAHLTLEAGLLDQIAVEEFDSEPRELVDAVGVRSPHIEPLFRRLLAAIEDDGGGGRLYPDSLLVVLAVALLREHGAGGAPAPRPAAFQAGGLTGWRLRRVVDYMDAELRSDIALADLTTLTGLSRAQFFRAFKQSTGLSPHRYLTRLRLDRAQGLLEETELEVGEVGAEVGLNDAKRFVALFKTRFGVSPRLYRLARC
ncbi:MAG: helix-turn-helix domain-containing protein [Caulobacteraceae bacterium]